MIRSLSRVYYSRNVNYLIWLSTALFYSYQMLLRLIPSSMVDYYTTTVGMNAAELGLLAGSYYLGYGLFQIPTGVILDKLHPRYIITSFVLLCVLGLLINIYSTEKYLFYLSRFLIGVGSIGGILGAVKSIDDFFPKKYSLFFGLTLFIGIIGSFYAGSPIYKFINKFGVAHTMMLLVYIGFGLAFLILLLYRKSHNEDKETKNLSVKEILYQAINNKNLFFLSICSGLMIGPVCGFADMWAVKYLSQAKQLDMKSASFSISIIFFGLGLGSVLTGIIGQKFKTLSYLIFVMGLLQIVIFLLLFNTTQINLTLIYIYCFLIGLLSSSQVASYTLAVKFSEKHMVSAVTSVLNTYVICFGFLFHYVIGYILRYIFISKSPDTLIFDEVAYHTSFGVILLCLLAGISGFVILSKTEKAISNIK